MDQHMRSELKSRQPVINGLFMSNLSLYARTHAKLFERSAASTFPLTRRRRPRVDEVTVSTYQERAVRHGRPFDSLGRAPPSAPAIRLDDADAAQWCAVLFKFQFVFYGPNDFVFASSAHRN
ncbi:unnamed protein product [Heligmosomoides polygyrus]|uniref:Uncharacterized protein n=1 Tax=Heligmosomoides polygyrus TaxID=6339 RepID=A0A183FIL4_HELPZ|nr:unnamed protein product [Heligmosomoides polygyrus]